MLHHRYAPSKPKQNHRNSQKKKQNKEQRKQRTQYGNGEEPSRGQEVSTDKANGGRRYRTAQPKMANESVNHRTYRCYFGNIDIAQITILYTRRTVKILKK